MAQDPSTRRHRIYLLTIWQERGRDPQTSGQWRFSLAHPVSGQRQGFASLATLVATLEQMTSEVEDWAGKEEGDNS